MILNDSIIKDMLLSGLTHQEIAKKLGVSTKTIQRKKKELIETSPELAQQLFDTKCIRIFHKSEEKFLKKVNSEKQLFEDIEEGWIYHITAEEMVHKASSKWWNFIVYPESAPENWKEQLINLHCELSISPLHDKDFWKHDSNEIIDETTGEIIEEKGSRYKSGDRKKAHWHCIIKFDRSLTFKEANEIIRKITHGPYSQKCLSLKGSYEYFMHLNNPDKYQYEKSEIEVYNSFTIEPTAKDRIIMVDEIGKTINEKKFTNIEEVRQYYEGQYEYINVISLKCFYFEKLTQVQYREAYPEGRIQRVRLLEKEK